jgi:hypothetical protein
VENSGSVPTRARVIAEAGGATAHEDEADFGSIVFLLSCFIESSELSM